MAAAWIIYLSPPSIGDFLSDEKYENDGGSDGERVVVLSPGTLGYGGCCGCCCGCCGCCGSWLASWLVSWLASWLVS